MWLTSCCGAAQLDQELLLGAQQRQQHTQPMSSPFARATLGSAFGDGSHRHGTPQLDLGHAISLPNPDALRAAGVSPGLGGGLHTAHSGSLGANNSAFAANSRVQVLLDQTQIPSATLALLFQGDILGFCPI
jgi:hypothetical protein